MVHSTLLRQTVVSLNKVEASSLFSYESKNVESIQELTVLRGYASMKGLTTIQEHVAVLRGRHENLQGQQDLLEAEKSAGSINHQ